MMHNDNDGIVEYNIGDRFMRHKFNQSLKLSKDGTEAKTKKRSRRNNEMPTNVNVGPISNNLAGSNVSRMTAVTTNVSNYNQ